MRFRSVSSLLPRLDFSTAYDGLSGLTAVAAAAHSSNSDRQYPIVHSAADHPHTMSYNLRPGFGFGRLLPASIPPLVQRLLSGLDGCRFGSSSRAHRVTSLWSILWDSVHLDNSSLSWSFVRLIIHPSIETPQL